MIFGDTKKYKNAALRYGLLFGAAMLLCHSVMYNWKLMQNDTKFIIMIAILCMLIWYTYYRVNNDKTTGTSEFEDEGVLSSILPSTYVNYEKYDDDNDDEDGQILHY